MALTILPEPASFPPVVVLGASGRLGQMLRGFWVEKPVVWVSRGPADGMVPLDIMQDSGGFAGIAGKSRTLICLAGVVPGQGDLSHNTDIALSAIAAASAASVRSVILCSSAAVYGRGETAWQEDMPARPISAYGQAKLDMERAARDHAASLGVHLCSLRIGNVAGADAILGGWSPGFALDLLPDGQTPLRSYIGPRGFADCLAQLVARVDELPPVLNVALPDPVRMGELLNNAGLAWTPKPATDSTIPRVVLNVDQMMGLVTLNPSDKDIVADWASWKAGGMPA